MESLEEKKHRAIEICRVLKKRYPEARCTLDHSGPYELLVATMLAAQCTDERVNMVTPALFKRYPDAASLAGADEAELQEMIRSTGFFRNKTKSLLSMAADIVEKFNGEIPSDIDSLTRLAGVGRKTANVVIANCFDGQAIIVDTHCKRLAGRLGFSRESNPDKIERDLQTIVPEDSWTLWSHLMVFHGRNICTARKPGCPECPVSRLCPWPDKTGSG